MPETDDGFKLGQVDPAAVLVAVLAAGAGPLIADGPWDAVDAVIAGVVGVILLCVTWPSGANGRPRRVEGRSALALSVAYGFVAAVFLGWPVQLFLTPTGCNRWTRTQQRRSRG